MLDFNQVKKTESGGSSQQMENTMRPWPTELNTFVALGLCKLIISGKHGHQKIASSLHGISPKTEPGVQYWNGPHSPSCSLYRNVRDGKTHAHGVHIYKVITEPSSSMDWTGLPPHAALDNKADVLSPQYAIPLNKRWG